MATYFVSGLRGIRLATELDREGRTTEVTVHYLPRDPKYCRMEPHR